MGILGRQMLICVLLCTDLPPIKQSCDQLLWRNQALNCTVPWGLLGYRHTWRRGPSSILWRLLTRARNRFTVREASARLL